MMSLHQSLNSISQSVNNTCRPFWRSVISLLSSVIGKTLPFTPNLILLNDDSDCHLSVSNRRILLAGITAVKRMVAIRWKQHDILNTPQWLISVVDILNLEISVARIHGAKQMNVAVLEKGRETIKTLLAPQSR